MSLAKKLEQVTEKAKADLEASRKAEQERMFDLALLEVKEHLPLLERHMMEAASAGKLKTSIHMDLVNTSNLAQFFIAFRKETQVGICIEGNQILLDWSGK